MHLPSNIMCQVQVKVLAIFCDEDKVRRAGPGENLRVRLSGIEEEDIIGGFVLSSIGEFFGLITYQISSSLVLKYIMCSFSLLCVTILS